VVHLNMPTARRRHQITETPEVARAIDLAAQRWPGEPRAKLLLRLVDTGSAVLDREREDAVEAHRRAVDASSGAYADAFGPDFLHELREDWPA
jgi:hypothetical protein